MGQGLHLLGEITVFARLSNIPQKHAGNFCAAAEMKTKTLAFYPGCGKIRYGMTDFLRPPLFSQPARKTWLNGPKAIPPRAAITRRRIDADRHREMV
jgi:hypothetical protein